jgi:SanA protein
MTRFLLFARHLVKYGIILLLVVVFFCHSIVENAAAGRVYVAVESVPRTQAALLLGTSPYGGAGRRNPFFERRIDAAGDLYRSGRVDVIVASGDNAHLSYNEPAAMTAALERHGVSAEQIVQDYAGFRTLDSVVRMSEVFGQNEFVIVSQSFHVERAIFLADAYGVRAYGYAAADVPGSGNTWVQFREYAARVRAALDVYVLNTQPRFLGEPVPLPRSGH